MHSPVHIRIVSAIEIVDRANDLQRPLRRRRGIEINQRFAMSLAAKDRKILANAAYIKNSGAAHSWVSCPIIDFGMAESTRADNCSASSLLARRSVTAWQNAAVSNRRAIGSLRPRERR